MRDGDVDAVIVVPGRLRRGGRRGGGRAAPPPAAPITVLHGPVAPERSRPRSSRSVGGVLGVVNLGGRPPLVVPEAETIQTENLNFISYFVPSMLGLSVMQVGIFAAIPLVADREKLILKRLAATPLRRWQLVGSNVSDAAAHRARPGDHHRRRRGRRSSGSRSPGRGRCRSSSSSSAR